jgi:exodeoxyribonuclease-5
MLTKEQAVAKDRIMTWIGTPMSWMFYLGGFAGTGKTFLLGDVINSLDDKPHCLAPTGKAASVLQKKLKGVEVRTIHSAIYKPNMPDVSELERLQIALEERKAWAGDNAGDDGVNILREEIEQEKRKLAGEKLTFHNNDKKDIERGDLVIVDEASMVTKRMIADLENTGARVLFVGDPGQLPPVGDSGYFSHQKPDALLSEVQRQALDNPIIELSMKVRQGDPCHWLIENKHILKRPKDGYAITDLAKADQVLTGTNWMRRRINRGLRTVHNIPKDLWYPQTGEKLICLKNQYVRGGWVINGVQCVAAGTCEPDKKTGNMLMDVLYEEKALTEIKIYPYPFEAHYNPNAVEDPWPARSGFSEFDFGYAITVHKSQGSEWDKVVLVDDEMFARNIADRKRWLYTAVTRAKEHLTWLTK